MLKMMEKQFLELERETVQALSQMSEIRKKIGEVSGMDMENMNELDIAQVPFAAYEMQLERHKEEKSEMEERFLKEKEQIHERHEREKDKMRKHYRNMILWITIPFLTFIIAVFGTVAWLLNTYDILTYAQDATYGNANFIGNDGDITNGEADYFMGQTQEPTN